MEKEEGIALSHLIYAMQQAMEKFEKAHGENDKDAFERARREVLDIQRRISALLR